MEVSSEPQSDSSGVWWSSWLSSAKEKSISALSATKRDLAEFVSVIGSDTKAVVEGASANINKIIKQSSEDEEKSGTEAKKDSVSTPRVVQPEAPYDRCQAELFSLQSSTETYLRDPSDNGGEHLESFEAWKSGFDIKNFQSDISDLLVSCHQVRSNHSQFVPARVSYETFWMRYFYKVRRLQKEEKRREDLMARASNCAKEQIQWDEEVEVIANPLLLKAAMSGHQRSDSSTDSFVCVSEETGAGSERSPSVAAGGTADSWEHVGSGMSAGSHESAEGRSSDIDEDVKKDLDRLFKKHGSPLQCSEEDFTDLGDGKSAAETECNLSDWEKWDD